MIFEYLFSDTFYYLTVALNFPKTGFFTYDQQLPTNGFHPLWQWILAGVSWLLYRMDDPRFVLVVVAFALNVIFLTLSLVVIYKIIVDIYKNTLLLFILFPVGVYAFITSLCGFSLGNSRWNNNLWNYLNGMESSLSILLYALMAYLLMKYECFSNEAKTKTSHYLYLVLVLVLLIYSRLDNIFVLGGFALYGLTYAIVYKDKSALLKTFWICALPSLFVLLYMGYNYKTVGVAFPISSSVKSSFPHLNQYMYYYNNTFFHHDQEKTTLFRLEQEGRALQVFLPLIVALLTIITLLVKTILNPEKLKSRTVFLLFVTLTYITLLHSYNILFVSFFDQGQWYFPIAILFLYFLFWYVIEIGARQLTAKFNVNLNYLLIIVVFLGYVFFWKNLSQPKMEKEYASIMYDIFQDRANVKKKYANTNAKFIDTEDGIIAFSLGLPALSGKGFCLDKEGAPHYLRGDLLTYAYNRGYRYVACGGIYIKTFGGDIRNLTYYDSTEKLKQYLYMARLNVENDIGNYDISVDYLPQDYSYVIFKIKRNSQPYHFPRNQY